MTKVVYSCVSIFVLFFTKPWVHNWRRPAGLWRRPAGPWRRRPDLGGGGRTLEEAAGPWRRRPAAVGLNTAGSSGLEYSRQQWAWIRPAAVGLNTAGSSGLEYGRQQWAWIRPAAVGLNTAGSSGLEYGRQQWAWIRPAAVGLNKSTPQKAICEISERGLIRTYTVYILSYVCIFKYTSPPSTCIIYLLSAFEK